MEALIEEPVLAEQPLRFELSFRPFLDYLKQQHRHLSGGPLDQLYTYLIDQFEDAALLADQSVAIGLEDRLSDYFRLATAVVMPLGEDNEAVPYAFGIPMPLQLFHYSAAFERLVSQAPALLAPPHKNEGHSASEKKRFLYRLVLEKCYKVPLSVADSPSFRFQRVQDGLMHYYQIDFNISFVEPHFAGQLPPLQPAWLEFAEWGTPLPTGVDCLPLHEFVFKGFSFFRVENITAQESLRQLREVFVHLPSASEPALYQEFETALRNFCGLPGLEIGLMPLPKINGRHVSLPENQQRSVFHRLTGMQFDDCDESDAQQMLEELIANPHPQVFTQLNGIPSPECEALLAKGIQSYLLYPVVEGADVLGLLEIGSPEPDAFTPTVMSQLDQIRPLMRELLRYQIQRFDDRLERRIKTRFTSLQPAVEWKFYEAAWEEIRQEQTESTMDVTVPVRFPQVYPLYGAIDVRGSSTERQKAIRQDLQSQLTVIEELLYQIRRPASPERLNALVQANYEWQSKLAVDLTPDHEQEIAHFLLETVNPFLRQSVSESTVTQQAIQDYFARTDPKTGQFNQALTAYEQTMDGLNATINTFVDQQETRLQSLFPHYFERYRTDGAEYTLYVGQSIAPGQPFGMPIRRQLYRWQVESMIEVAQLTRQLRPKLPLPLQTTQLILSHAFPVDISFRRDERRFDVEGSYSIRYEVLKKRIDKVRIKGTNERLTQPDTLALVYSRTTEINNYLPFIAELQAEGKLLPGVEYVDLEPVQGVSNLKAVRVTIAYAE